VTQANDIKTIHVS